jgi:hypothetical protein
MSRATTILLALTKFRNGRQGLDLVSTPERLEEMTGLLSYIADIELNRRFNNLTLGFKPTNSPPTPETTSSNIASSSEHYLRRNL